MVNNNARVILVTGGFDPVHSGHIELFNKARELGDLLFVGVNSDAWLTRKKGRAFLPLEERMNVVGNMKSVGHVFEFDDSDNTALKAIDYVRNVFPKAQIIFVNGGDRTVDNIPELMHTDNNLVFKFGIGGEDKKNSSSWILNEWKAPKTERTWGYYNVIHEIDGTKVKELTVNPGKSLSMQKHYLRKELWFVAEGTATVMINGSERKLNRFDTLEIEVGQLHRLSNRTEMPLRIVEIQYGSKCVEEDIQRWE